MRHRLDSPMPRITPFFVGLCLSVALAYAQSTAPKPIKTVAPVYPALEVKKPVEGRAVLNFTVNTEGKIVDAVVKSADDPAFGDAVLAVLPMWEFEPATKDGKPVNKKVGIPFEFKPRANDLLNRSLGRMVFKTLEDEPIPVRELGKRPERAGGRGVLYPKSKEGSGESQRVRVQFVIGKDGLTYNPEIMDEVGNVWAMAAYATVANMKFKPLKHKGKPVAVRVNFPLNLTERPAQGRGGRGGGGGGGQGGGGGGRG
ncbi:MAG: hypothetical protein SynsKO_43610 [Synoicihabitans sp.]